jgi:hypothetical protein
MHTHRTNHQPRTCIQERGLQPPPGSYGAAMNALGKAGRAKEALALLE